MFFTIALQTSCMLSPSSVNVETANWHRSSTATKNQRIPEVIPLPTSQHKDEDVKSIKSLLSPKSLL